MKDVEYDAGHIEPSTKVYIVTLVHYDHTLKIGDRVVMTETPMRFNYLLRLSDMTLHCLQDSSEQYVHLMEYEK